MMTSLLKGRPTVMFLLVLLRMFCSSLCIAQEEPKGSSSCCGACFQGQAGTPGVPGIPGNPGGIGVQGNIGPKGDPGLGLPGPKGETGDQGRNGDQGEAGMRGVSGKLGPAGRKGDIGMGQKGDQGLTGVQGPPGEMGQNGQPGEATLVASTPPSAVAFSVFRKSSVSSSISSTIIFDNIETNLGNGYDSQSGMFTCSIPGAYFFTASFLGQIGLARPYVKLKKNDELAFSIYDGQTNQHHQSSNSAVVILATGDRVWLEFGSSSRAIYCEPGNRYCCFSGFLISAL